METKAIRVGIADPEAPFRAGIRSALRNPSFEVIDAGTLAELSTKCELVDLDVLLVDERLYPVGGIADESVGVIARVPTIAGLIDVFQRGAIGYIDRSIDAQRLRAAVEDIAGGVRVAPRGLIALLIASMAPRRRGAGEATRRQSQISVLAEEGLSTREIAVLLNISPVTVRRHHNDLVARQQRERVLPVAV